MRFETFEKPRLFDLYLRWVRSTVFLLWIKQGPQHHVHPSCLERQGQKIRPPLKGRPYRRENAEIGT